MKRLIPLIGLVLAWATIAAFADDGNDAGTVFSSDTKSETAIRSGDKLVVRLSEDPEFGGVVTVSQSGVIILPLINEVVAQGLTLAELRDVIKERLEKDFFRRATVSVLFYERAPLPKPPPPEAVVVPTPATEAASATQTGAEPPKKAGKVYVVGQVAKPGVLRIPEDEVMTVGKAIVLAGGFTEFAAVRKVKLVRMGPDGKKTEQIINAARILREGHIEEDVEVKDGDWIVVPQSFFNL